MNFHNNYVIIYHVITFKHQFREQAVLESIKVLKTCILMESSNK